jgi:hypothetical protein
MEVAFPILKYIPGFQLEGLSKPAKNLSQDSQSQDQD